MLTELDGVVRQVVRDGVLRGQAGVSRCHTQITAPKETHVKNPHEHLRIACAANLALLEQLHYIRKSISDNERASACSTNP